MAQFQNDELEYVVDDYFDIADFEDTDAFAGNQLRESHGADSDFDDDEDFAESKWIKFVKCRWDKEDCISYWQKYKASLSRLY